MKTERDRKYNECFINLYDSVRFDLGKAMDW